jgi:histidinol-phosphate aminotransferase
LRIGYVIAPPAIIGTLSRVVNPKNVSTLAQAAAEEALEDLPAVAAHVDEVIACREMLLAALAERGFTCQPSHANFVLVPCDNAAAMARWLQDRGIFVRDRSAQLGGAGHLRVTVGGRSSTERLIAALDEWLLADGKPTGSSPPARAVSAS